MKPEKSSHTKRDTPKGKDEVANSTTAPATTGVDARDQPEKLKRNRDQLGVDEEHKTPDMSERHRGTFP